MANIILASGGTTSTAGTATTLAFRRCDEGLIHVPQMSALPPFGSSAVNLPGSAVYRIEASRERGPKNGTVRVMLRVRVKFPVARMSGVGAVSQDQEITLHTVLTMPSQTASMLLGQVASADEDHSSPRVSVSSATSVAVGLMVSLLANQTIDITTLVNGFNLSPLYMGVLGVCPIDADAGTYGTDHPLPPSNG